jgi:hypothetical protein
MMLILTNVNDPKFTNSGHLVQFTNAIEIGEGAWRSPFKPIHHYHHTQAKYNKLSSYGLPKYRTLSSEKNTKYF